MSFWPYACTRFKRAGALTNGILECNINYKKTSTVLCLYSYQFVRVPSVLKQVNNNTCKKVHTSERHNTGHTRAGFKPVIVRSNSILECKL